MNAYPTLMWRRDGGEVMKYSGGRSLVINNLREYDDITTKTTKIQNSISDGLSSSSGRLQSNTNTATTTPVTPGTTDSPGTTSAPGSTVAPGTTVAPTAGKTPPDAKTPPESPDVWMHKQTFSPRKFPRIYEEISSYIRIC